MAASRKALTRFGHFGGGVIAISLLVAGLGLPFSSWAQGGTDGSHSAQDRRGSAATEHHIAILHARLHITAAQEPLWEPLAAAMRNGVAALDRVYAGRGKDYGSMSAVEDLKSYASVQEIEARNVQSLITPFAQLYASFSTAQKRQADATFRRFTENAARNTH